EGRDRPVLDRRGRLQAQVDAPLELLARLAGRDIGDAPHDLGPAQLLTIKVEVTVALTVTVKHAHGAIPSYTRRGEPVPQRRSTRSAHAAPRRRFDLRHGPRPRCPSPG